MGVPVRQSYHLREDPLSYRMLYYSLLLYPESLLSNTSCPSSMTSPVLLPPSCPNTPLALASDRTSHRTCTSASPLLAEEIGGAGWGRHGGGGGAGGVVYTVNSHPAPFQAPITPLTRISNNLRRETSLPRHHHPAPHPDSLLDGLAVAVSLALGALGAFSYTATAHRLLGAAALGGLAGLAAVLQCGAGVGALQAIVLQDLGLEYGQVILAAADLGPQ